MSYRPTTDAHVDEVATALAITPEEAARRILTAVYSGQGGSHRPSIITNAAGAVKEGKYAA